MTEDRKNKIIFLQKEYSDILEKIKNLNKDLKKITDDECDIRDDLENSVGFISDKNHVYEMNICLNLECAFDQSKKIMTPIKNTNKELSNTIKILKINE